MDSASSLAYPGSRVLAGWWRQLQPHRPSGLWMGHLFVHRVEALAKCAEPPVVDALALHVLRALAIDQPAVGPHAHDIDPLLQRLHLPAPALQRLLIALEAQQLARRCEPGCWCVTDRGRTLLEGTAEVIPRLERRVFPFVERLSSTGRRLAPPRFLPLLECPAVPWPVDDTHAFDVALLEQTVSQPPAWRERYKFPSAVHEVITASSVPETVVVDRPERLAVALAISGSTGDVLGFAVRQEGWKLLHESPVLQLPGDARDALPELTTGTSLWDEAWRLWCRQRHLPQSEAEACGLHFDSVFLDVHAPRTFVERLRATRSELLQGESGLLAGDGYLRAVALLRLRETDG